MSKSNGNGHVDAEKLNEVVWDTIQKLQAKAVEPSVANSIFTGAGTILRSEKHRDNVLARAGRKPSARSLRFVEP